MSAAHRSSGRAASGGIEPPLGGGHGRAFAPPRPAPGAMTTTLREKAR